MAGDPAVAHRVAYLTPWVVAQRWRAQGGRVVGCLGRSVPREIVAASGMLPVRLSPLRLGPPGGEGGLPDALAAELAPGQVLVLGALLSGTLDWIDALVIGRDSEADTKLFYVLRELARIGACENLPPVAFADLLRSPSRTSARYNRIRARELADTVAAWAGRDVGSGELLDAVADAAETAELLRRIDQLRTAARPSVRGSEALIAAGAAQVLPGPEARMALAAIGDAAGTSGTSGTSEASEASGASGTSGISEASGSSETPRARVFVTGSGQDDIWSYEALEAQGVAVVGEDHTWGDDGLAPARATRDPLDGIVDRYHLSARGAARAGLSERSQFSAEQARRSGADAVLQIVFAHDEAPEWEVPALRCALGATIPIVTVRLRYGERDDHAITRALDELGRGDLAMVEPRG